MKSFITFLLIASITGTVCSQTRLEKRLDSLLQGHINKGEIHGCMAYVFQKGEVVINKPYGYMNIEDKIQMKTDAIFRIASMTKILTAATALKLYEEGKFLLDEPVKKYIPEFANLRVISPDCKSEDSLITIPLERDVTIRDLFRHTAGFGYGGNDIVGNLYAHKIVFNDELTLEKFVLAITSIPLKYQPGSKWEYSFSNDILGYLIEVISGKPLDEYMDDAIFKPLQMTSTGFSVSPENISRLSNFYAFVDNKLVLAELALSSKLREKPTFVSGGGGAVSTTEDYSKFCQMLLNFGEYHGKRILRPQTVELLISNQIGEIKDRSFEVSGFGFGVGVNPVKYCGGTASCFWAGSPYNDTFMFDYDKNMIAILFIQNAPWGHLGLMEKFESIVNEEIK